MRGLLIIIAIQIAAAGPSVAATDPPDRAEEWQPAPIGASILLTNHGFGVGAFFRHQLGNSTTGIVELSIGAGKDEREQEFFSGPFGETVTPFKRHYFMMLPVLAGVEQRMWREAIEDNFRPFVQLLVGPVVGYQWPYFDDVNDNGIRDPGEDRRGPFDFGGGAFRLGMGGTAAFGAIFGEGRGAVGVRIGYTAQYFPVPIDLLEPRPEIDRPSRNYLGSPVISLQVLGW